MAGGIAGAAVTLSVRAVPVPQALVTDTLIWHVEKLEGQSMDTALKLFGPEKLPQAVVHV